MTRIFDVYKERQFTIVKLGERDFKLPNEYTVEEVERLLELKTKRDEIENEVASDDKKEQESQLVAFWGIVFDQLEVIFQHYQPDITADDLRSLISHHEALGILGFYDKYRFISQKNESESGQSAESKKKILK